MGRWEDGGLFGLVWETLSNLCLSIYLYLYLYLIETYTNVYIYICICIFIFIFIYTHIYSIKYITGHNWFEQLENRSQAEAPQLTHQHESLSAYW